jgi:3-polyprenyl-4-hydroxybenzoate decarboxylase
VEDIAAAAAQGAVSTEDTLLLPSSISLLAAYCAMLPLTEAMQRLP